MPPHESTLLDRLVGWASPRRGYARMAFRQRMAGLDQARAAYEGASQSHRTAGRWISAGSANRETRPALVRLRNVSRDLVRNNPYAARCVAGIVSNVVGEGIHPTVIGNGVRSEKRAQALVDQHLKTTAIDFDGRNTVAGLQALIMRTVAELGEALVIRYRPPSALGLPVPLQIRVLEPDFLDWTKDGPLPDGAFRHQGVEFDKNGRRVAYWLYKEHPLDTRYLLTISSVRVPAEDVLHVYRVDRPGQARGVPWGAPVFMTLMDLADYEDAELMRQKIAACFAVFFIDGGGQTKLADASVPATGADLTGSGNMADMLEPGLIQRLPPETDVKFATPPVTAGYADYVRAQVRKIALGFGVPYELAAGDLGQVNFSSGRMGWLEFQRSIDQWRGHMLLPHACDGISRWFVEACGLVDPRVDFRLAWTPPRREMIDPTKEIAASRDAVRSGLTSRSEELRKQGYDPDQIEAEIAAENARADALKLKFDSDGRWPAMQPLVPPEKPDGSGAKGADDGA